MQRDIRETARYRAAAEHLRKIHEPSLGRITSGADPALHPSRERVAFSGDVVRSLEGVPGGLIGLADRDGIRAASSAPHTDRLPRWSPDGTALAFLSDRAEKGVHQVALLDDGIGEARAAAAIEGVVEYLSWSPDGTRLLLGVAGRGADQAGGQGSGTLGSARSDDLPSWLPEVEAGPAAHEWRAAWILDVAADALQRVGREGLNVWEAAWAGPEAVLAVCSDGDPTEDAWYDADLRLIDVAAGTDRVVLRSDVQLGVPVASPSGARLAVVEAVCSDRWIVAGDLLLVDRDGGGPERVDTLGVDVVALQWLDEQQLAFAGLRGLATVLGVLDLAEGKVTESWSSTETCGTRYPQVSWRADGTAAVLLESYERYPEVALIAPSGEVRTLASLRHPGADHVDAVKGRAEAVRWRAPDGVEIEGILTLPAGDGPFPLLVHVHGGPVWAFRERWRMGYAYTPWFTSLGYAVLHPNPRGSSGRGQAFAAMVVGDMGGADTHDYLAGVDALVERGIADPQRLGVFGGSYGGYMTAWLVTQDPRFGAAVAIAPVIDWYSQNHTSNLGGWGAAFLGDDPLGRGQTHERSPLMHADRVGTPVMCVAGGKDRCTPPGQAMEFHRALRARGVESALVIYPEEGHGVRALQSLADLLARMAEWFDTHLQAR